MVLWSVMVPRSLCLRLSVCQQLRDNGSLSHNRRLAQQEGGGGDGEKISACEGQTQPAGDAEAGRRERVRQEDRLAGDGAQQAGGQRQTDQALQHGGLVGEMNQIHVEKLFMMHYHAFLPSYC